MGTREPIPLTPVRDPATGQVVYVDLEARGGRLYPSPEFENGQAESAPLSKLPEDTMASATWEDIAKQLRADEEGRAGGPEVALRPGGEPEHPPLQLSQLPPPCGLEAEIELLRRLDPHNDGDWEPVTSDLIAGWAFWLTPPFEDLPRFAFFAFRSPADGGLYRISVLQPNMDNEHGHLFHMTNVYVDGQRIPVIDPGRQLAADLVAVRAQAVKWMYATSKLRGPNAQFGQ
ncbi:hypothetical protein ACFXG9_13695 [Streptomyces mirabilis]|uniref:hypothetical protein n=1 Tax=Streptomyces mirabilis TaxID=68239 RepID=UPI0036A9CFA5